MNEKTSHGSVCREPGDTPLKEIPGDYYPRGCGFWFVLPEGRDRGRRMFFRDNCPGDERPASTIVLVHGNPECSYSYRNIIERIVNNASGPCRIIAMDHIGFGLSDRAGYEMNCRDHAENLLHLIRHLDPRNVTLVVHDWGGPIGIGAFLKEPGRVSNLIVLNTTLFPIPEGGLSYHTNYPVPIFSWSRFPSIFPDLLWGIVASYTVYRRHAGVLRLVSGLVIYLLLWLLGVTPGVEKEARRLYRAQLRPRANARSSKNLARETASWGRTDGVGSPSDLYRYCQENITGAWGPEGRSIGARALLGRWDPLGSDEVIGQWVQYLPQLAGHVSVFENTGHFINIERPDEIAEAVLEVAGLAGDNPVI